MAFDDTVPGDIPQNPTYSGAATQDLQYPYYVDPKTKGSYKLAAQLLRAQFADWQNFFQPIELEAMQQLSFNNPQILANAVSEAKGSAESAYNAMGGILERQNRALGVKPTAQQETTTKRLLGLDKALAMAGAENKARANVRSQDEEILLGISPNPNIVRSLTG